MVLEWLSFFNAARDGVGRRVPDVLVADTRAGTSPHLVSAADPERTFCGQKPARVSRTWFELAGCERCRKSARKAGIASITDVDGRTIRL